MIAPINERVYSISCIINVSYVLRAPFHLMVQSVFIGRALRITILSLLCDAGQLDRELNRAKRIYIHGGVFGGGFVPAYWILPEYKIERVWTAQGWSVIWALTKL